MALKITPLGARIIVKPIDIQENSELLLPDGSKEKPQTGEVIEVGPGVNGVPLVAKKGDTVFYRRGAGISLPDYLFPGQSGLIVMTEGEDTLMVVSQ